ncbi:hypothetical protein K4K59_012424 [Colletotrichum sp. SAR11_240]|nr:hypothetical protein K4K59_012424 [Colletotrichum sp. SAR11_240]
MQEHFTQQEAGSSPLAQKNAAEKPSGALMSLNIVSDGTANQAFKSSPASDAATLEHEPNAATKDSASVDKDSDCQRNTGKSAEKKLVDKERSKKKRAMKKLENKGVCMESIGKEGDGKNGGDKDVDGDNADGNCTLRTLEELRDFFFARGEAFISSKNNTNQKASTKENEAFGLLKEYLLMKIIVL